MDLALVTPTVEYRSYLATCNTQILRGKYEQNKLHVYQSKVKFASTP